MNKEDFLKNIDKAIEAGVTWKDKTAHLPARKAIEWVKEAGLAEVEDSFLSNGYAWDWWCSFTLNNNEYILGGSGYDGGMSFEKIND